MFLGLIHSFNKYLLMSSHQPGANCWVLRLMMEKESLPAECTAKNLGAQWSQVWELLQHRPPPAPMKVALPSHGVKAALPHQVAGGTAPLQPQAEHGPLGVI